MKPSKSKACIILDAFYSIKFYRSQSDAGSSAEGARFREGEIAHAVQCCLASLTLEPMLTCNQPIGLDQILKYYEFWAREHSERSLTYLPA